jgi:hypothetical protein
MDKNLNQLWNELEDLIRREPRKSVALALAGGFVLCLLPLGRLLGVLLRVMLLLFKPLLLILGVLKLIDFGRGVCGSGE